MSHAESVQYSGSRTADVLAAVFVLVIVLYAAAAPLEDFVSWIVRTTTEGFEDLSRRDQRLLYKKHWAGEFYGTVKRSLLAPTGLILGLPLIFSFAIIFLTCFKQRRLHWVNWSLALLSVAVFTSWIVKLFAVDGGALPNIETLDSWLFPLSVCLTLFLTWRLYGGFIVGFCIVWILYFFLRGYIPDALSILQGSDDSFGQNFRAMVLGFWVQTGGIFGQPLQVVSGKVLIFIVFGAVLVGSGAGELLLKIANRMTGGLIGGAAHAAVASSALFGTLSGAAISNVVTTGTVTIPIIKKSGFSASFAGGVEASASTGGQIMPPVMGVVAFFVAAQIGLEYRFILVAAIMPAIFYYLTVFLTIYFEARKQGIGPMAIEQRPPLTRHELLQTLVFVLPLSTLTYLLLSQPSIPKAGFYAFWVALLSAIVLFPRYRRWRSLYKSFVNAGKMAASIIIIVAAIGLIVGLINESGFGNRLAQYLVSIANGPLFFVLTALALGSIVLGMGLPPGATYFVIVVALSSGIDAIGIAPLSLHLFVIFFAMISTVTPPVALAAFAAAPIAGSDPIRTGIQASRLSIAGFIIPFVFVYHPAVIYKLQIFFEWINGEVIKSRAMIDIATVSWFDFSWIVVAFVIAMWLLSSALVGFEKNRLSVAERIVRIATSLALLAPNFYICLPALLLAITLIVGHRFLGGEPSAIDATDKRIA